MCTMKISSYSMLFNAKGGINYKLSLVMCLEYGLSNRYFLNFNIVQSCNVYYF